jgi:GAF domain-containing protein
MFGENAPDLEALGRLIREQRRRLDLTQSQLGERLGWVQERISLLENGKYGLPSLPALIRVAQALELSLSAVLTAVGYSGEAVTGMETGAGDRAAGGIWLYTMQRLLEIEGTDLPEVLTAAADLLTDPMGAEKIDAFFYNLDCDCLVALGTSRTALGALQIELNLHRIPLSAGGRIVQVYQTGRPFLTGRTRDDPEELSGIKNGLKIQSSLDVPLTVDGERRGVLAAASTEPDRFSSEDLRYFQAVARWVGLMAHRAELMQSLTNQAVTDGRRQMTDEFVAEWTHALKNLLVPLKGRLDLIRRRAVREAREQDIADVDAALRAYQRLQHITTDAADADRLFLPSDPASSP